MTLTPEEHEARYVAKITSRMVKTMGRIIKLFFDQHDKETSVGDMVANLMHYCDAEEIDFQECYDRGRNAYNNEVVDMLGGGGHADAL